MVSDAYASHVPAEVRATLSYLRRVRAPGAIPMLLLQGEVEREFDDITDGIFDDIERELEETVAEGGLRMAEGAGGQAPQFEYDTRLLLPALITHAHIHLRAGNEPFARRLPGNVVDESLLERGYETTGQMVRALLDGDMRDALNDEEYEDFETNLRPKRRVAEIAQSRLQSSVEEWFANPDTSPAVETRYREAVELSETHQSDDVEYRALLEQYRSVEDERGAIKEELRERYKFAQPKTLGDLFDEERELSYFATQYARVGVIYEGMLGMYEADLGLTFADDYRRAIVLVVIAAQVGLDDTDDYPEDRGSQLTPVTAELALADDPADGVAGVRRVVEAYLDMAEAAAPDHLTGIAVEYVRQQSLARVDRLDP